MKRRSVIGLLAKTAAAALVSAGAVSAVAHGDWQQSGFLGDLNNDSEITIADAVLLSKHLLGREGLTPDTGYPMPAETKVMFETPENVIDESLFNTENGIVSGDIINTADIDRSGRVDVYDLVMLRQFLTGSAEKIPVWFWQDIPHDPPQAEFIDPPIYDLYGSMPSQGTAEMMIFYVDFPDCRYDYLPSEEILRQAAFGDQNISDFNYPFESIGAFYQRSSKGSIDIDGQVFTYTAKNNKSYYENDVWKIALVDEIIAAFDSQVDFSQFDGDNDGTIDSILISVPTKAGDDDWWPAAGIFGGDTYNRADGVNIGHVIVGNAQIEKNGDRTNFVSSYVHELGHCMGLPDYYLYTSDYDFQGMHGSAGFELMDDANCDLGAASKLMLGWYTEDQVNIFDRNTGSATYTLSDAQSEQGNCIIIPCGELGDKFRSEFFILEYATLSGNNSGLGGQWWQVTGSGVRIYHVEASVTGDFWYNSWKYASGNNEATNYDRGRRFIRLVGEGSDMTENFFISNDIIDGNHPDLRFYDQNGNTTIDPGISITIGEKTDAGYSVTITAK